MIVACPSVDRTVGQLQCPAALNRINIGYVEMVPIGGGGSSNGKLVHAVTEVRCGCRCAARGVAHRR